jgi:hypothetical protein
LFHPCSWQVCSPDCCSHGSQTCLKAAGTITTASAPCRQKWRPLGPCKPGANSFSVILYAPAPSRLLCCPETYRLAPEDDDTITLHVQQKRGRCSARALPDVLSTLAACCCDVISVCIKASPSQDNKQHRSLLALGMAWKGARTAPTWTWNYWRH